MTSDSLSRDESADPGAAAQVRLFFAFWPDGEIRDSIARAAATITDALANDPAGGAAAGPGSGAAGVRAVAPDNYHVTLAFVGAVSRPRVDVLRQIGREQRAQSLAIRFDAYEYWPKPEVVVAAAHDVPSPLADLWRTLHRDLLAKEFALTPKALRPHVTLFKNVAKAPALPVLSPFTWRATKLCLVRSDTGAEGSVYTVVDHWPLLDK
jgi:2'-5' RNA ligase